MEENADFVLEVKFHSSIHLSLLQNADKPLLSLLHFFVVHLHLAVGRVRGNAEMMGKPSRRENSDLLPPPHMHQCFSAVPTCSIPGQNQLKGTLRRHLCSCWITAWPAVKCDLVIQGIALQSSIFRDDGDSAASHRELLGPQHGPFLLVCLAGISPVIVFDC